jgi:hypothetical protein
VDKIQQARGDLKADADLVLFGQIAYTGSSSMDILMKVFRAQDVQAEDKCLLVAPEEAGEEGEEGREKERARQLSGLRPGMPEVLDGDDSGAILTSVYTFVARDGRGVHLCWHGCSCTAPCISCTAPLALRPLAC